MAKKSAKKSRGKRFSLYWCTTPDGDEDWFVVAASAREGRRFHEDAEGYDVGEADAERITALPDELRMDGGWRDGPKGKVRQDAGWPSDALLVACGGEIAKQPRGGLQDMMGVVCKDVRFGSRVFRAGDVVTNMDRAHDVKEARLSVFKGGRRLAEPPTAVLSLLGVAEGGRDVLVAGLPLHDLGTLASEEPPGDSRVTNRAEVDGKVRRRLHEELGGVDTRGAQEVAVEGRAVTVAGRGDNRADELVGTSLARDSFDSSRGRSAGGMVTVRISSVFGRSTLPSRSFQARSIRTSPATRSRSRTRSS